MPQTPQRVREYDNPLDRAKGFEVVWSEVAAVFNAAVQIANRSFVYVIGEFDDDGPVKIGLAKDPVHRRRAMQTGNPRRLRVEHVLVGKRDLERMLHEYWEPYAVVSAKSQRNPDSMPGTEWFKPEIRDGLLPILDTAAEKQVEMIQAGGDFTFADLSRIVIEAHIAHDFVFHQPDEVRHLAWGAGYTTARSGRLAS